MGNNYILTSNGAFISVNELYHHGILGMKWGVRRYQNEDGSLTAAGYERYYGKAELDESKENVSAARATFEKSSIAYNNAKANYARSPTNQNKAALDKAEQQLTLDAQSYKKASVSHQATKELARNQGKALEIENKSKHRQKLEDQYKSLGLSDKEAEAAANRHIRTEKILAAAAGMTVAGCVAYMAVKHRKEAVDGVIKAGQMLQRIEMRDTGGKLHDAFYAAAGKHDMQRYYNLLGSTRQKQTGAAYVMKLMAQDDIKVASRKNAQKVFESLLKNDPEFKTLVRSIVGKDSGGSAKTRKLLYEAFNRELVGSSTIERRASSKFYNALKAAGYGAIQDINDMKYSGYNAKNPLIIFGNSSGSVMVQSMTKITETLAKSGKKELSKAALEQLTKSTLENLMGGSAVVTSLAAVSKYLEDPSDD